ncbi:YnfA family protein [Gluconacetobacter entanii]
MNQYILSLAIYMVAGFCEIGGCFAFWAWLRQGRSMACLIPGMASLVVFAWLLTRIDTDTAGQAYAAYGGIYILASLTWMRVVEGYTPTRWEILGAAICLVGAGIILFHPRNA